MKKLFLVFLFSVVAFSLYAGEKDATAPMTFDTPQKEGVKATCPVTKEVFTINNSTPHSEYKGKHIYFCCDMCKPTFDKDPEKFLKLEDKAQKGDKGKNSDGVENKKGKVNQKKESNESKEEKGEGHKHQH
jgi:YHS domain-containing protein